MCDDERVLTDNETKIVGHNLRCERSTAPKKTCKCECGGVHHGISLRLESFYDDSFEQKIDETFGGKVWRRAKKLLDKTMMCRCEFEFKLNNPQGYEHPGGLPDKNDKPWWLYYKCPICKYDWSWWIIVNQIRDGIIK